MGLLTGLLLLPITGPARGLRFILQQIKDEADAEMLDENRVHAALMALSLRYDLAEISEDEYLAEEAALLQRLSDIRAYKMSLAQEDDDELEEELEADSGDDDGDNDA